MFINVLFGFLHVKANSVKKYLFLFFKVPTKLKNNCCLFGRLFKVKRNGVFLFGISFFVLEIFTCVELF